jgi:hypothetical protein
MWQYRSTLLKLYIDRSYNNPQKKAVIRKGKAFNAANPTIHETPLCGLSFAVAIPFVYSTPWSFTEQLCKYDVSHEAHNISFN